MAGSSLLVVMDSLFPFCGPLVRRRAGGCPRGGRSRNRSLTVTTSAIPVALCLINHTPGGCCVTHLTFMGSGELGRLQLARINRPEIRSSNHDSLLNDDDEMDSISKFSSEDSEEASGYFDDSDDSIGREQITNHTAEMDLLGEILDTLSIHSNDQGRLSGAKSLDFFRSMEDIDYKAKNKSCGPSENNLSLYCGGSSAPQEWLSGQDDTVLHGKHLPPSPRKQISQIDFTDPFNSMRKNGKPHLCVEHSSLPSIFIKSASPLGSVGQLDSLEDFQSDSDLSHAHKRLNQTQNRAIKDSFDTTPTACNLIQGPLDKEETILRHSTERPEILEEVAALCHITSDFNQSLNIPDDHISTRKNGKGT